jgi:predicted lipid-binding transport protein (Tim44 family)
MMMSLLLLIIIIVGGGVIVVIIIIITFLLLFIFLPIIIIITIINRLIHLAASALDVDHGGGRARGAAGAAVRVARELPRHARTSASQSS